MWRTTYLAAVALAVLCGCQDARFWEKKGSVPITRATETMEPPTSAPATQPSPPQPSTAPAEPPPPPIPLDDLSQRRLTSTAPGQTTIVSGPQVVAGVTIQVNEHFLSVDDVLRAAALELAKIPAGLGESAFRPRAEKVITEEIRRQISQLMVLDEAERALTDEQKKLIDQEMDQTLAAMVSQTGGSRKKLEDDLANQGTTLEAILANQRRELTVRWYLRWKFSPVVSVTRAMLWDYYSRHQEEFAAPKKVQMQIIFVPPAAFLASDQASPSAEQLAAARTAARAQIDQAAQALKRGEDFAAVARRFSSDPRAQAGGLWPPMPAGSFRQEQVERVAFSQAAGQVSDVIETDEGFYLVKTTAVQGASTICFEDAQGEIEKTLRDQQSAQLYNDYYATLLAEATIVQSENFVPTAVGRAVERYRTR